MVYSVSKPRPAFPKGPTVWGGGGGGGAEQFVGELIGTLG